MTGNFPFVSLEGSVCYFIMYHYESNSILATPITGQTDIIIFDAYKQRFKILGSKGFKVKVNVMDNQATKHIKKFLTEKDCEIQLVEPHNKRLNAAEQAIQTWNDAMISALATTDADFPPTTMGLVNATIARLPQLHASISGRPNNIRV